MSLQNTRTCSSRHQKWKKAIEKDLEHGAKGTTIIVVVVCEEKEGAEEIALFSMLRREFEAVVSMLMSVPRFFVRDRGAQPLNYFKYFQTFVARGD